MIWAAIGVTAILGLVGLTGLAMAVLWAFDAPDFEDWMAVAVTGLSSLMVLFFAAVPWMLGAGAS